MQPFSLESQGKIMQTREEVSREEWLPAGEAQIADSPDLVQDR